jgi:hypothetical protein
MQNILRQGNFFETPEEGKKLTQEQRVLKELQNAKGKWINGQYFLREMMISQYHRAIHNLQKKRECFNYTGEIEASPFTDEYGFKSYRLLDSFR